MEVLIITGFATAFVDSLLSVYCLDFDCLSLRSYCCSLRSVATDVANAQRVYCNASKVQSFHVKDHCLGVLEM